MTSPKKKSRLGLAAVTAVLSLASIFALASPASAEVPPNPPENVTAEGGINQIVVHWSPTSVTGAPDPTDYVVFVGKYPAPDSAVAVHIEPYVAGTASYTATITGLPAGNYRVWVVAHNANALNPGLYANSSAVIANPDPVVVKDTPVTPVNPNSPFRPYINWDALINREYQMWTGCNNAGRLPRLDELTFWRQQIVNKPFTNAENEQVNYYGDVVVAPAIPGYRPAMVRPTYWTGNFREMMYPISSGTADDIFDGTIAVPYTYGANPPAQRALADTNNNGIIEPAERTNAINSARSEAVNDVYFGRRAEMIITLAEGAEQTDGPAIRLYKAYFDRDPDIGVCYWSNQLKSAKMSLLGISNFFVNSSEFVNTYGAYTTDADEPGTDAAEFVALIYNNVLDRDPDAAGFAYWTRQLQSQRKSPAEVMVGFSEAPEFKNKRSLSTGVAIGYIHALGRTPTAADYVIADFNNYFLNTSPECGWSFWGCYPDGGFEYPGFSGQYKLYERLVGTKEYTDRALSGTWPPATS